MNIRINRKSFLLIICLSFLAIVVTKKGSDIFTDYQERKLLSSLPNVQLHSNQLYHEVDLPFLRDTGHIEVTAISAGEAVSCILDTGGELALWPQSLPLASSDAHLHYSDFTPYSPLLPRDANWRILSDINFGNYELQNCAGVAYDAKSSDPKSFNKTLIMGYPALAQIVLTIDYHKQKLVFRDKSYDVTHLVTRSQSYLLDMVPSPKESLGYRRSPLIAGTVAGYPVRLILDTGMAAGGIVLANPKLISVIGKSTGEKLLVNKATGGKALPDTLWSLGNLIDQSPIDLMPGLVEGDADGVIGSEVLRNFRITIDYGRHKVLLEENPLYEDAQIRIQARKAGVFHSPQDPFAHIGLGKAYLFAKQYENAKKEFMAAVFLDVNNAFAHFKLGQCYYYLGKYADASQEFKYATNLKPTDAFSFLWLGRSWSQEGQPAAALKAWKNAIALDKTGVITQEAEQLIKQQSQ